MWGLLGSLMGDGDPPPPPPDDEAVLKSGELLKKVADQINTYASWVSVVILSLCGLLVTLFAIYVGIKFGTAEDDGKRKEAKSQLIYSIIGIVSIAIVYGILHVAIPLLKIVSDPVSPDRPKGEVVIGLGNTYHAIFLLVNAVVDIFASFAVLFALYIGWKLMSAEGDQKRKDAKMQLIYTIIGILIIVFLNTVAQAIIGGLKPKDTSTGTSFVVFLTHRMIYWHFF